MTSLWVPPDADLGELAGPEPDLRMVHFGGDFDASGLPLPMTYRKLHDHAATWPVTVATPAGPASLLKLSREQFALAFYAYELAASAVAWSIFAVEAALKLRLEKTASLHGLIRTAMQEGLIEPDTADVLDAGRQLRNKLVHGGHQPAMTFAMSDGALRTSHLVVAELFPDGAERLQK
ncbi:hypothetical protein I6A60_07190 [Frankia sp. AgB1.9]|uniref:hypothetical protein n=1 Tax=unclassified Frankia TaxID=2632575 RepID=UPI0019322A90|nr:MULTISPECIES: hypothetical protein [unclassified Frankia]MBL7488394.1 hypothetical protein [Frankia sp. AgW1.1]MBL7547658.1 hypothetical protein [Frankia sp. AgB1.9]MBL7624097.1 hypothetical protein [Frankia sp. AgB1.8]